MKPPGLAVILVSIVMLPACSPVTPAMQEAGPAVRPTVTEVGTRESPSAAQAEATAMVPSAYHPLDTRTDNELIDRVLQTVASRDLEALRAAVEFTSAPCTTREGFGGPPKCREGEAEGTVVEAMPFLDSEGGMLRRDEIDAWIGVEAIGLYAIYENSAGVYAEEYYPAGRYSIVFMGEQNQDGAIFRLGERGIVRVESLIDMSPQAL